MKKYYHLIGVIILIVILAKIDFQKMITQFTKLNIVYFILINLLIIPSIFIKSYRWRYLLRLQGIDYSVGESFISYLGGIFASIITPGRIGEAIKTVYLKEDKNIPLGESLASIFIDRFFDLYLLALLGSLGFFHFLKIKAITYNILIILFILFIPFLLLNKTILEKIIKAIYNLMIHNLDKNIFKGQFKVFFSAVKKIIMKRIYLPFILTILAYLIIFWQSYLLARLISINISYTIVIYVISIVNVASLLPITILGLGTREISLIYIFSLIGLNIESAVSYSFLLFFSFYVLSGVLAFFGWYIKGKNKPLLIKMK